MKIQGTTNSITAERAVEIREAVEKAEMSKGAAIREMFANGMSIQEISKTTGILYNHCYNIAKQEVLKHGLEIETTRAIDGNSKKSLIIQGLKSGASIAGISRELGVLYNYVWQVAKKAGMTPKQQSEIITYKEGEEVEAV